MRLTLAAPLALVALALLTREAEATPPARRAVAGSPAATPPPSPPESEPEPEPEPPRSEPEGSRPPPIEPSAPSEEPTRVEPTPREPWLFLELRAPVGRFERRRESSGGSEQLRSLVDVGPSVLPSLRVWLPLVPWLSWGGELSGGFGSSQVDGGTSRTTAQASLLGQLRLTPWQPEWGQPQLTLGVGGWFWSGPFADASAGASSVVALLPRGTAELGALVWLVPGSWGLEFAGGAGYAFGPGWLESGGGERFLQRLTFELGVGVVGAL